MSQLRVRDEFEPQGVRVFPISAVAGQGLKELLFYVKELLEKAPQETLVFEPEYFPGEELVTKIFPTLCRSRKRKRASIRGRSPH